MDKIYVNQIYKAFSVFFLNPTRVTNSVLAWARERNNLK